MEFGAMISMPAMTVPFERLSPKHKNNTTCRGLEATDEQLYQMLSENGIEALYDDREETHWDSINIDRQVDRKPRLALCGLGGELHFFLSSHAKPTALNLSP
jgi:hypothetical protein